MRIFLIVFGWVLINLLSYVLPIWLGIAIARDESEALLRSGGFECGEHDTPAGIHIMGAGILWTGVLLVVNAVAAFLWWKRPKSRRRQESLA